jgi:hypothetical protein
MVLPEESGGPCRISMVECNKRDSSVGHLDYRSAGMWARER